MYVLVLPAANNTHTYTCLVSLCQCANDELQRMTKTALIVQSLTGSLAEV